jgi:choline monooxygenase
MNAPKIEVHPDITQAGTLPSWVYRDPQAFDAQRRSVFERSWQLVGDASQVRVPGQVFPFTLLEGCLDEPLMLTRDFEDRLHCLTNVCTHRGAIVCEGPGVERHLRCRYHGRRFGLDGQFQHMPEFEQVKGFPSEADNLRTIALAQWGPMLFASMNPSAPFEEFIAPIKQRLAWLSLDQFVFDPSRSRDYHVRCNWALYCDNYLEGFHIPFVHAGLNEKLDYGNYHTELFEWCNLQLGVASDGEGCFDLPKTSPYFGQQVAAFYWWVFPNTMFNFYPWGLSVNIVRPLAVDRTRVSYLTYVWDASKLDQGAGTNLDRVEREDEAVVESVQRGVQSRLYVRGRYSPKREQGVHHFHRLLARAMNESATQ